MKKIALPFIVLSMLWIGSCKKDDASKNCSAAPTVSAGVDQELFDLTTATLTGTTDASDGTWSILEGTGGSIQTGSTVVLTGQLMGTYKLKFESTNECGTTSDEVIVSFFKDCGDDQTVEEFVDNIHWIQQSCFRIEASNHTIYVDPNNIISNDIADLILITHPHDDHYSTANLNKLVGPNTILIAPQGVEYTGTIGKRVVLTPGQTFTAFGCITVKAVPAYNIVNTGYHPKGNDWVGYLITVNGVTIYHAGDTELIPEMNDFTCDIALLPLGQTYTFVTVADAVQAAKDVEAKVAIPMHYGLYEGTSDDAITFKNSLDGEIPVVIKVKGQ